MVPTISSDDLSPGRLRDHDAAPRLKAVLETTVDAIITIDVHGTIESVNPATERMFGYSAAEMLGSNVSMLMAEPHRARHDRYLQHYLMTGERRIIGLGREVYMILNWPPIGRLVTALSLQAIERAEADATLPRVEAFAGGLREGLALKATLRAQAQGRDEYFVHAHVRQRRRAPNGVEAQWDPVVWLFSMRPRPRAHWMVLAEELDEMLPLAQRPEEMRAVQRERGTVVVEQIGFGTRTWASNPRACVRGGHSMYEWSGMLIYVPTHFTLEPTAWFVENTQYRSTPVVTYTDPTYSSQQRLHDGHAVTRLFRETYGMRLDLDDWPTTLIRMAIPFAQSAVTVIAPDLYSIPIIARNEAARHGVDIRCVPHSAFPRERLSAISIWYGAGAIAGTLGTGFPEEIERRFGEPASANSRLLPPYWRHYGERCPGEVPTSVPASRPDTASRAIASHIVRSEKRRE